MPTPRTAGRSPRSAPSRLRNEVLDDLKEDHQRVRKAYRDFLKLGPKVDREARACIVDQVLRELTVHAALEEELLYPAAREALADEALIDQAEVEHASVDALIGQLRVMNPEDLLYTARFTVLCEYVLHHVKEEEDRIFPKLERAGLDWASLATDMSDRREELTPATAGDDVGEEASEASIAAAGRARAMAGNDSAMRRDLSLD